MNIYVSNLSFDAQDADLKELFTTYGAVSSAKVITDKLTGKSRGFGFVEMADNTAATQAISELNDTMLEGRSIRVTEARPKENGSGNNRSGSNSNGFRNRNPFRDR